MTNLEAMQDEDLRQMIHDAELLERLSQNLPSEDLLPRSASKEDWAALRERNSQRRSIQDEVKKLRLLIGNRWRELMEE
ncbi:hypothetical protein VPHK460_0242 [Vibrio phage K460]